MALKDWKKNEYEGTINYKKGTKTIKIIDHEIVYGQSGFGVYLNDSSYKYYEIWRRKFKTKSQALKYARSYMRTH